MGCKYSTKHDIGHEKKRFDKKSYVVFDEENASIIKRITIEAQVKKTSDVLHYPVRVIRSIGEIDNSAAKRAIENGRNVKGWYDTNSGDVVIYLPNATSAEDVQATILHEVVGHYGLRKLFGESFDSELMGIYKLLPEDVRKDIATEALRKYDSDLIIATEEYLARQAEKNEMPGWWNRVVSSFKDFLRKMGISLEISDNDVRYLLWKSYQNLKGGNGILEQAQDIAFQMELGVGRFRKEDDVNERFNEELSQYKNGRMKPNEMFHLGTPQGAMLAFLPDLPIVMSQRTVRKGIEKKHNVDVDMLKDMPSMIASPIFVFQRDVKNIGILTEMIDRDGKREVQNVVLPIINNGKLFWVDKEKAFN